MATLQGLELGIAPTHSPWLWETGAAEPRHRGPVESPPPGVAFEFIVAESRADADADAHVTVTMPNRVLMFLKGR